MDEQTTAVLPTVSTDTQSETAPSVQPADGEEGLCVVFNREPRLLSRQEATSYAQQGLKWEQFAPLYRKLHFVSDKWGGSVGDVIDSLVDCWEAQEWEALSAAHPDDPLAAAQAYAAAKQERERTFGEAPSAPSDEERLAREYTALCAEIPDAPALADLPDEVWDTAQREDIPLLDAYLRVLYREQRRVQEAQHTAAKANAQSCGSMRSEADMPDTAGDAFRSALSRVI